MLRRALLLVLLVCLSGLGLAAWQTARGSGPANEVQGSDGAFTFTPSARRDGAPCLDYEAPGSGGRTCFTAVGARGGWALEAEAVTSEHDVVLYGATIGRAARVRIGGAATLPTGRYSKRFRVRFFSGLVPRRALRVAPNRIVALDRRGRLLGRQHYNDGHGGFGRCDDGLWDRKHFCPKRR